ncbi:lysostaphin resistance A-like protein [Mucilaginibacter sp.]|uniref:CPBP family intramembrane glutamic endopeptidase n=1 Tax=Mucilaginibacter sp. TaxID=1882438 RepID=UPI0035BC76CC
MVKRPVNQMTPALQFLLFIVVTVVTIIVFNLIGLGVIAGIYGVGVIKAIMALDFAAPGLTGALYILQLISTTIPIFLAPIFFAGVVVKDSQGYLKPTIKFPWMLIIVAFFITMISSPLIELSGNINQKMVLPEFLKGLERWMKDSEEAARRITMAILKMDSVADCIKNVILIGLLTAIAEEFMFRGALQTIMQRWTKNTHAAIWITAALFSAFHMEFYGFLPRMLLGAMFGYFVAWSGSIWPAIWGHFVNNGTAVVATYLYQQKKITISPDDQHVFNYAGYIFSFIIIIILLMVYKKIASATEVNGEELG